MKTFHSPYQFIPIKISTQKTPYTDAIGLNASTNHYVRHDYWHTNGLSGRITGSLTTSSPLVVGAEQTTQLNAAGKATGPARVSPYRCRGNLAIPGSSLRGMIASIVETLSQSSLRVLASKADSHYTVRQDVKHPLKDMGILYKKQEVFYLYKLPPACGVHVYQEAFQNNQGKQTAQCLPTTDAQFVQTANSYQHGHPATGLVYANCQSTSAEHLSTEPAADKTAGVLYIRGKHGIKSKIKETFIPWGGQIDEQAGIEVTQQVQALESTLRLYQNKKDPQTALPKGYQRDWNDPKSELVQAGDILYYQQQGDKITELSYSQIWRRPVNSDLHHALEQTGDQDTVPWHQGRHTLTPAECMFGVVEEQRNDMQATRNLASRIRFSDAVASKKISLLPPVTLKILDSPKPPSPAMYFHQPERRTAFIEKCNLDLNKHRPNGRKHYLPQPHAQQHTWETKRSKQAKDWQQYLSCTPISPASEFHFTLHFENLSQAELGLLQIALQPSHQQPFMHRLGLGKPLGLGQVTLHNIQTETIDRVARYRVAGLTQTRYQPYTQAPEHSACDPETLALLCTLANPENISTDVCYPYQARAGQAAYNEQEGFQWFGQNTTQMLKPLQAGQKIPTLKS